MKIHLGGAKVHSADQKNWTLSIGCNAESLACAPNLCLCIAHLAIFGAMNWVLNGVAAST
jgi:hypothetical protein